MNEKNMNPSTTLYGNMSTFLWKWEKLYCKRIPSDGKQIFLSSLRRQLWGNSFGGAIQRFYILRDMSGKNP